MDEASSRLYKKSHTRDALIEFYRHNLSDLDKQELTAVLDSIFLTTGKSVATFEGAFAKYMGSNFAVGLTSCTHALELALKYFDIGSGDEVITTPMTFVATANAIEYVGAKPIFVDVEIETGNINADLIEAAITDNTRAIMPVHLYGQMCDMKKIRAIADKYNLKIIEDSAHCVEGMRDGVRPGELGDISCYSFYATKNLTCGEGGAITCNDPEIYQWFLMARQHGISKDAITRYTKKYEHYDMKFLGTKSNMSNIQASLLINQLGRLDEFWGQRKTISKLYDAAFDGKVKFMKTVPSSKSAYHLYTILVSPSCRDEMLHNLQDSNIGVAVNYRPVHHMSYYVDKYGYHPDAYPVASQIGQSTISLPMYPKLSKQEVDYIIDRVLLFNE